MNSPILTALAVVTFASLTGLNTSAVAHTNGPAAAVVSNQADAFQASDSKKLTELKLIHKQLVADETRFRTALSTFGAKVGSKPSPAEVGRVNEAQDRWETDVRRMSAALKGVAGGELALSVVGGLMGKVVGLGNALDQVDTQKPLTKSTFMGLTRQQRKARDKQSELSGGMEMIASR